MITHLSSQHIHHLASKGLIIDSHHPNNGIHLYKAIHNYMTGALLNDIYFYPSEIDISGMIASRFAQDTSLHFSPLSPTTYVVPFLFHQLVDFTHEKTKIELKKWQDMVLDFITYQQQYPDDDSFHNQEKLNKTMNMIQQGMMINAAYIESKFPVEHFHLKNPLFWKQLEKGASFIPHYDYSLSCAGFNYHPLMKFGQHCISTLLHYFENLDDVIDFSSWAITDSSYGALQYELILKGIKKFSHEDGLHMVTPFQQYYINKLKEDSRLNVDDKIRYLKIIQLSRFDLIKDVFIDQAKIATSKKLSSYLQKILVANQTDVHEEALFLKHQHIEYYEDKIQINFNYLKKQIDNDIFITINLLELIVRHYNAIHQINISLEHQNMFISDTMTLYIDELYQTATFTIKSHQKEKLSDIRSLLEHYIDGTFSEGFLTPTMRQTLSYKNGKKMIPHSQNDMIYDTYQNFMTQYFLYVDLNKNLDEKEIKQSRKI